MAAAPAGRLPVPHHNVQGPIDVIPQYSACGSREESRNGVTITKFGVTIFSKIWNIALVRYKKSSMESVF